MVKKNTGKFRFASRGKTGVLYIPADIVKDSSFPFQDGDNVTIEIVDGQLVIKKEGQGN